MVEDVMAILQNQNGWYLIYIVRIWK
jgi:hypothetical protein